MLESKARICYSVDTKGTTAHKVGWPYNVDRKTTPSLGQSFGVVFLCSLTYKT